jgi:hypothetical protein
MKRKNRTRGDAANAEVQFGKHRLNGWGMQAICMEPYGCYPLKPKISLPARRFLSTVVGWRNKATKGKREENETMISMGKKANAFFFPGSHFLFLSFFSHDFHRKII